MRDFGQTGKKKTGKRKNDYIGRLITIGGRSKGELAVMMMLDKSGQLNEDNIKVLENGSAGTNMLLNVGALLEYALENLNEYNFELETLDSDVVEIYVPGVVSEFINGKWHHDIIEEGRDSRAGHRNRKITEDEIEMWENVDKLIKQHGDHVAIRSIGSIALEKTRNAKNNASYKELLLNDMQAEVWNRVPDPDRRGHGNGSVLKDSIGA